MSVYWDEVDDSDNALFSNESDFDIEEQDAIQNEIWIEIDEMNRHNKLNREADLLEEEFNIDELPF